MRVDRGWVLSAGLLVVVGAAVAFFLANSVRFRPRLADKGPAAPTEQQTPRPVPARLEPAAPAKAAPTNPMPVPTPPQEVAGSSGEEPLSLCVFYLFDDRRRGAHLADRLGTQLAFPVHLHPVESGMGVSFLFRDDAEMRSRLAAIRAAIAAREGSLEECLRVEDARDVLEEARGQPPEADGDELAAQGRPE